MTDRIGKTPPELCRNDDREADEEQTDTVTPESGVDFDAAIAHSPGRAANATGEAEPDSREAPAEPAQRGWLGGS